MGSVNYYWPRCYISIKKLAQELKLLVSGMMAIGSWSKTRTVAFLLFIKQRLKKTIKQLEKVKTLQVKDAASGEEPRKFPTDTRLNINAATPQMISDHIKGIGMKTAKDIKDLQTSLSGERFHSLEQLRQIKRVDWDSVFAADLIRV